MVGYKCFTGEYFFAKLCMYITIVQAQFVLEFPLCTAQSTDRQVAMSSHTGGANFMQNTIPVFLAQTTALASVCVFVY